MAGGLGAAGGAAALSWQPPRSKPCQGDGQGGAEPRGSPSPNNPRYLASCGVRRHQGQGRGRRGTRWPWAGRAEMSRGKGSDGMAAGGPPSPCTILIQMGCPLKGTAVSRLRECHCRFLLPGGPRRPPARGGQAGQASAARARPGPRAAPWAPPANKRAPRGLESQRHRVPRAPGTERQERARCHRHWGGVGA